MPINRKKMNNLTKEYGKDKAKKIYYALENKSKGKTKPKKEVKKK